MLPRYLSRSARAFAAHATEVRLPQASRQTFFQPHTAQAPLRSSIASSRWYSAEAEPAKTAEKAEEAKPQAEKEDPVKKELEAKKKEVVDITVCNHAFNRRNMFLARCRGKDKLTLYFQDKYKRQVAEYRNLQEQTKREVQAARDFALQRFAKDLIDSVDNLDRALGTVEKEKLTQENKDLLNLHDGLRMTETILLQTLKKHGLERFDPSVEGEKFDPNKHEATFQVPQPDKTDGTVFHTQQKGFALNGRVLRVSL